MYCLITIVFLLATCIADGDVKIGMAIAAGLFGVADSIYYHATRK